MDQMNDSLPADAEPLSQKFLTQRFIEINRTVFQSIQILGRENPELARSYAGVTRDVATQLIAATDDAINRISAIPVSWVQLRPELGDLIDKTEEGNIEHGKYLPGTLGDRRKRGDPRAPFLKLAEMNFRTLHAVRDIAARNLQLAAKLFGASTKSLELLIDAPIQRLISCSNIPVYWFTLKQGSNAVLWKTYLGLSSRHWADERVISQASLLAMQVCMVGKNRVPKGIGA